MRSWKRRRWGEINAVRPVARRLQHRFQESDRRALAVGARHMNNRRQPPVRVAKRGQQALDASQREIDDLRVELLEARKKAPGFFLLQMRRPKLCEIREAAWRSPPSPRPALPKGERGVRNRRASVLSPLGERDRVRGSFAPSIRSNQPDPMLEANGLDCARKFILAEDCQAYEGRLPLPKLSSGDTSTVAICSAVAGRLISRLPPAAFMRTFTLFMPGRCLRSVTRRLHSLLKVSRISCRCTTMSIMPCASRYSDRWKPSGSFSRMVCSITRGPAKPISAPGSAMWMSPSIA